MTFSKQIAKNNAKVQARRKMENPLGMALLKSRIERNRRIFMRVMFITLLGFIGGALYLWPELLGVGL